MLGFGPVKCTYCDSPVSATCATCPYCHKDLKPWSMNAPWVLPTIITLLALLIAFVVLDQTAGWGYLDKFFHSRRPGGGGMLKHQR
jgi:hypothetical protein